jgi:hypothetical protein
MGSAPHMLVVTADPDDPEILDHEVECPAVTDECREWRWCTVAECTVPAEYNFGADAIGHGERHKYIKDRWMVPTDNCYVVCHDGLPDAVADRFPVGRHAIGWDVGDGTEIEIYAIEPAGLT